MFFETLPDAYSLSAIFGRLGEPSPYLHFLDFDKHAGRRNDADDGVVRCTFE